MSGVSRPDEISAGRSRLRIEGRRSLIFLGLYRQGRFLVAAAAGLLALAAASPPAQAGNYIVAQCSPGVYLDAPDVGYASSTSHYVPFVDCSPGGPGLRITHVLSTNETGTVRGAYAAWVWQAPAGTWITGGSTFSRLATQHGHHGYMAVSADSGAGVAYQTQNDDLGHTAGIPAGNWRYLVARLECTVPNQGGRCVGSGSGAHTQVKQVRIQLTDVVAPTVSIGGSLFSGAVLRGPQTVTVGAADEGAGLQTISITVNGKGAAGDNLASFCNPLPGNLTARMVPCPQSVNKNYTLDTAAGPFREGVNSVSVCVSDYAQTDTPNSDCEFRDVFVDNLCPGSRIGGGYTIAAGFGNGKRHRTLPFRKRALIRGKVRDRDGNPVAGADVCIAGHTNLPGRPFHLIGTVTTNENGGWSYKLRHGPSRIIRAAYRFGAYQTLTDLKLHMRARSTFHLSRHRTCVGQRIYFTGGIAGPRMSRKVVVIRGTIPGSKRLFLVRRAKTDPLGHFRVGYAFAPVTRLTRFVFWALIPEQDNYPYVRGRSVVRFIRVRPQKCRQSAKDGSGQRRLAP